MYQVKQCALSYPPQPTHPHCWHTHVPSSSPQSPHLSHVQHRPPFRLRRQHLQLAPALSAVPVLGPLPTHWPLPTFRPLPPLPCSILCAARTERPTCGAAHGAHRLARQPAGSQHRLCEPFEGAHKDVAKRACSSWQELSVEYNHLHLESCCSIFCVPSPVFHPRQTPPRERARIHSKRHLDSPGRNTWESTLTAKLALALPLILLLSNAVVLLDILPLLLLLHGMARRCTTCPAMTSVSCKRWPSTCGRRSSRRKGRPQEPSTLWPPS